MASHKKGIDKSRHIGCMIFIDADARSVIIKLFVFSLLIIVVPISVYYILQRNMKGKSLSHLHACIHDNIICLIGDTIFPAISAAVAANIILLIFIIVAFTEDQEHKLKIH